MSQRRFMALLLSGAMALSLMLSACGGKVEPTATPDGEPSAQATETPVQAGEPTAAPDAAETDTPDAQPTEASADANGDSVVQAVWSDISALDLPAFMDMDDDVLNAFYGLDVADLVEYVGKIPMMNVQATEFFIAQVKPGQMDTVKAAVDKRVSDLVAQWSQYLPEQLELVEDARVVTSGDYIMLAISYEADAAVEAFNAHAK